MPNTPHTHRNPGQMRSTGLVSPAAGAWGPAYSPGDIVVFGPPGSSATDGQHGVIPGLQLQMGLAPVPVPWGTAAMVVRYNPISAHPGLCLLVKGFVGWTTSAAVFPIDEHIGVALREGC
jgi:hypothetical protein